MKNTFIKLSLAAVILSGMAACKKQLEVEPRTAIPIDVALSTRENINATITGIYARLKSLRAYGRDLLAVSEALSENGFATNKSGRLVNEAALVPGAHFGNWATNYFAIAEINLLFNAIPNVQGSPAVTQAERNAWRGQLYFLRALFYFDLARVYCYEPGQGVLGQDRGGIPIVTSTPLTIEGAVANLPARAPIDSVYAFMNRDIDSAIANLTTPSVFSPAVASRVAAQALGARISLYDRDYTRAATLASAVISARGNTLTTPNSYVAGWSAQVHPESIFEIRFANNTENLGVNESLQTTYTTLRERGNPAVTQGFGDLVPTTSALQILGFSGIAANGAGGTFSGRTDDVRNLLFERGSAGRGTARIECTKFIGKNGQPNLDNIPVIRIAEMYLIRSEARSYATNRDGSANSAFSLSGAVADIVTLKQARYANYATTQGSADAALASGANAANIQLENFRQRRIEFMFEGHRWFDHKRNAGVIASTTVGGVIGSKQVYTDFRMLAPVPQREVDLNPGILQNFGY